MTARVFHADLWGEREGKYEWLAEHSVADTEWTELEPQTPFYLFRPYDAAAGADYHEWTQITDVMPVNVTGVITARDDFAIDLDRHALLRRMNDLRDARVSDADLRTRYFQGKGAEQYPPGDTRSWKLPRAREQVRADAGWQNRAAPVLYRPFDTRFIYYVPWIVDWPRTEAMPHMLAGPNLGLDVCRQVISSEWAHCLATDEIIDDSCVSNRTRERGYLFPLYLYPNVGRADQHTFAQWPEGENGRRPNLDPHFVNQLTESVGLEFVSDGRGDLEATFGPEDVLHYIYAIFHCPTYRERYAGFLKLDFPRVPITSDKDLFVTLCKLGGRVMALHLLEAPDLTGRSIGYPVRGDNIVAKGYPKYVPPGAEAVRAGRHRLQPDERRGRVHINPAQFFEGVEPPVWQFQIGGYQVAEKWLKDRRERALSHDDITHYTRTIEALRGTVALMAEIDEAIPEWPIT